MNGIPPKTHLTSLILFLMIKIINSTTYFFLKAYTSIYINFLNFLPENCDGDKESQGCANIWLISSQLSSQVLILIGVNTTINKVLLKIIVIGLGIVNGCGIYNRFSI